jgi:O-antigen ligase
MLALSDYLLALSLLITVPMVVVARLPIAVPFWIYVPNFVITVCLLARQFDPTPYSWRSLRIEIQGDNPDSLKKALIWLAALYVVPFAVITAAAIERRVVEWVMGAYVIGVVSSCGVAMTDTLGLTHIAASLTHIQQIVNPMDYQWGERKAGLADHPNMFGMVCVISLPIVIYFIGRKRWTWVFGAAFIAVYAGLLISGSRGAQAISLLTVLVSVLCLPNKRTATRTLSVSISFMVVAGILLLSTVLSGYRRWFLRFAGGGTEYESQRSNETRIGLLEQAWSDFRRYPIFGAGLRHISEAHNIFLQLLAAGGVVLAAGMVAYIFFILRDCWQLSRGGIVFARFLMISIASWLLLGMVQNEIVDRELYFTIGCVAALIASRSSACYGSAVATDLKCFTSP